MNIREQIDQLRQAGDYFNLPDHPVEDTIMYVSADTMERMLAVVEAAILVLDEADDMAEKPYEAVSPAYIQDVLQSVIDAVK